MFANGINLNAHSYNSVVTASGSLCVPVKPNAVIYSQFDYVHGTPTKPGQNGVSVDKVKILNTLISQLVSMKKKDSVSKEDVGGMTEEQKDNLIKQYQQEIKNAVAAQSASAAPYGLAGVMPEAGTVVSVCA